MSTINADLPYEGTPGRLGRSLWRLRRTAAKAARTTGRYAKRGGYFLARVADKTARMLGLGIRYIAVTTFLGVRWTLGAVLSTVSWTLRGALSLITSSVTLVTLVVATVVLVLILGISSLHGYWKNYVHPAFTWLMAGGSVKSHYASVASSRADRRQVWLDLRDTFIEVFQNYVKHPQPVENTAPYQSSSLDERMNLRVMDDANNEPFPGTAPELWFVMEENDDVLDYDGSKWPWTKDEASAPTDDLVTAIQQHIQEQGKDIASFEFAPWIAYNAAQVVQAFEWITDNGAFTDQERAYWIGRYEGLRWLLMDPENIKKHGRGWSLVHNEYQSKAATVPLRYLRTGFMDSVKDMEIALENKSQ